MPLVVFALVFFTYSLSPLLSLLIPWRCNSSSLLGAWKPLEWISHVRSFHWFIHSFTQTFTSTSTYPQYRKHLPYLSLSLSLPSFSLLKRIRQSTFYERWVSLTDWPSLSTPSITTNFRNILFLLWGLVRVFGASAMLDANYFSHCPSMYTNSDYIRKKI